MSNQALDLLAVGQLIDDAMRPGHFFIAPEMSVTWIAAKAETIPWEIFHGRLLDAMQTRAEKAFLSWHLLENNKAHPATEPTISVKLDVHGRVIHVTRGLLSYAWEGFDTGGGVIESREAIRWMRELVGTITLDQFAGNDELRDELICLIRHAVVGTSRLPLMSVEAPLPCYVFGKLHYAYHADSDEEAMSSWEALLPLVFRTEPIKIIEFILRRLQPEELPRFADLLTGVKFDAKVSEWWRKIFNDVSLSPYTGFVDNALNTLELLAERGDTTTDDFIDFLSYLLRQLGRHLTAYDLVTFHHRGANYPDALLLDTVLKRYMRLIERFPSQFSGDSARMRRRALRQGSLMRRHYEGHLVPDLPTSPGENARVMPTEHPRVPEEQLLQSHRRRRQLFTDDPLTGFLGEHVRFALAESIRDLAHLDERAELGLGLFIDRPLGYAKSPVEPDQTPLLAHEAFSPSLARRRWQELLQFGEAASVAIDRALLDPLFEQGPCPVGLPHSMLAECPRPTAALADVRKVADDLVILRTMPGGLTDLLQRIDFAEPSAVRLALQVHHETNERQLVLFDAQLRRLAEIQIDSSQGYVTRGGVEWPQAGCIVRA